MVRCDEIYLPSDVHIAFYRLIQEAFNNITKHSHATSVSIDCDYNELSFFLKLEDNGKGFDIKRTTMGMGISTMRERVEEVGAKLTILSEVGKGTKIIVEWNKDPI